jgi:hypothetical protein
LDVKERGDSEVVVVKKRRGSGEDESIEKTERDKTLKRLYLLSIVFSLPDCKVVNSLVACSTSFTSGSP